MCTGDSIFAWLTRRRGARSREGCVCCGRLLSDCCGNLDCAGFEVRVLLYQIMWKGGIEEAIDIEVVMDEIIIALVVLASGASQLWHLAITAKMSYIGFFIPLSSSSLLKYFSLCDP
jgi:hypothetical protein